MGDFISNNPNGKSDLHTFAPPAAPEQAVSTPPPEATEPSEASHAAPSLNPYEPQDAIPVEDNGKKEQAPPNPYQTQGAQIPSKSYQNPYAQPTGQTPPNSYQAQNSQCTNGIYQNPYVQPAAPIPYNPYQAQSAAPVGNSYHGQSQEQKNTYGNGCPPPYRGAAQTPPYGTYTPYDDPYGYAIYGAPPPEKSPKEKFNLASLILGIASWAGLVLCCGCISPFTAIASIILAFMGKENGKFNGKAVAGIITSVIFLVIFLFFIFILALGMSGALNEPAEDVEMMTAMLSRIRFS